MCVWPIFQKLSGRQFSLWPWLALTYLSFLSGVRRDQNSWKFAFWRRFWHGAVEHCSMVLHWSSGARHLRKFACGPAVSRSATNFRNIRAPQHRANGVCNLCLGEPPVITTCSPPKVVLNERFLCQFAICHGPIGGQNQFFPCFLAERLFNCTFLDI